MTQPTIEQIAAGLTEAQRAALEEASPPHGAGYLEWGVPWQTCGLPLTDLGLVHMDNVGPRGGARRVLTPLGLAVRNHLQDHSNG